MRRLCDETAAYAQFIETTNASRALLGAAEQLRLQVQATRSLVAANREMRARQGAARSRVRAAVNEYVAALKQAGSSLDSVLRITGQLMHSLRLSGSVPDEEGVFEVEIQRMVAEEYVSAGLRLGARPAAR